jgi:hypothetical protein
MRYGINSTGGQPAGKDNMSDKTQKQALKIAEPCKEPTTAPATDQIPRIPYPEMPAATRPAMPPLFTPPELSVIYRALMEIPMRRNDQQYQHANSVLQKIDQFAQAQRHAQAAAAQAQG